MAPGIPPRSRERVSGQREAALVGRPGSGAGTEGRSAGSGDRFFERVLAAHRGNADAGGVEWRSAVYRKVKEEMKADRGLTVERMTKLARISRASFYRFEEKRRMGRGCGYGSARCDPADRARMAELRTAAHHPGVTSSGLGGELEASLPADAGRQSAVREEA